MLEVGIAPVVAVVVGYPGEEKKKLYHESGVGQGGRRRGRGEIDREGPLMVNILV